MKLLPWIGVSCCLLLVGSGCRLANTAGGYPLWQTSSVMGNPDSLLMAKQRVGIDTFPVKDLQPPPSPTNLLITIDDEDQDGMVYFAHTNERLHYLNCVTRIEEILQQQTSQVNLEIRTGKRAPLSWVTQFDYALRELKDAGRLNVNWQQGTSTAQ